MKRKQLLTFLGKQSLFRDLAPAEIETVADRLEILEYTSEQEVFAEGQPCDGWYVIVKGEVVVVKSTPSGADHELARLEAGEGFGEMGLIDDAPRLATVSADGPTTLARLPRAAFHALLLEHGSIGARIVLAMARVLCERQRGLTAVLTDLVDDPETAAPGPREMMAMLLLSGR